MPRLFDRPSRALRGAVSAVLLALPAVAGADILIGQSVPLTGPLAPFGEAIVRGATAYFDRVNALGGVRGERIVLRTLDDGGDPSRTVENARSLIAAGAIALFGSAEGGPCSALIPVVESERIPMVACMAGTPELRTPHHPHVFPVRAEHASEFAELLRHAAMLGHAKVAFLHARGAVGRTHLSRVSEIGRQHRMRVIGIELAPDQTPEQLARRVTESEATAILNHGAYSLYAKVIKALRASASKVQVLATNSGGQQFARELGPLGEGVVMTQVVPYPTARSSQLQRDYQDDLRRRFPDAPFDFSSFDGYIGARILTEGLRRATRLTRDGLREGLERLGSLALGDYVVEYSPKSHDGARFVTLTAIGKSGFVH